MYFIVRAFKYLIKKKGRTILLGIIFLVIANFVLAGLLMQNASVKAEEGIRRSIGSKVEYLINWERFLDDTEKGKIDLSTQEWGAIKGDMEAGIIINAKFTENGAPTYQNFLRAVESDYVVNFDMSISIGAISQQGHENYTASVNNEGATNEFQLMLFNSVEPQDFIEGNSELTKGRYATEDEIASGASVILLEKSIMEINGLKIGDSFAVKAEIEDYDDITVDYEIIGVYETLENFDPRLSKGGGGLFPQNQGYVPFKTLLLFGMSEADLNDVLITENAIYLDDPINTQDYIMEAESLIGKGYGAVSANEELFDTLMDPINNLGYISNLLVLVISIAGALIIGLITALTTNDRKEEIGILLAIGEKKKKIVSQFIIEVLIIAIISFGLSTITGSYIGRSMSDAVLNNEFLQPEDNSSQDKTSSKNGKAYVDEKGTQEKDIDVDIDLEFITLFELFGIGLILSIVSTSVPSIYVMRFNPKQILTNKNL